MVEYDRKERRHFAWLPLTSWITGASSYDLSLIFTFLDCSSALLPCAPTRCTIDFPFSADWRLSDPVGDGQHSSGGPGIS